MGEMSKSIFQVIYKTRPLKYFLRGRCFSWNITLKNSNLGSIWAPSAILNLTGSQFDHSGACIDRYCTHLPNLTKILQFAAELLSHKFMIQQCVFWVSIDIDSFQNKSASKLLGSKIRPNLAFFDLLQ